MRWYATATAMAWITSGCGGDAVPETPEPSVAAAPVIVVDTATVDLPLELPTQLYVEHDAYVYARSMGIVERVLVDIGDRVREGQVLARLESVDQEIALADAQANLANAERQVQRFRELAGTGAVAVADSEFAELEYRRWELGTRQAQRNYDLTRAIAPFSGVVTARVVRRGRLVEELDSLFRVSALQPLRASVQLPEGASTIERGTEVTVVSLDGSEHPATVDRVSPTIDPSSGTREVVVQLARGTPLEPGASVRVRLAATRRQILVVPAGVVAEEGYVLVWAGGRTSLRSVTLGATLEDGRVEVVRGLAAGERLAPVAH